MKEKFSKLESVNIKTPNIENVQLVLYVFEGFAFFGTILAWFMAAKFMEESWCEGSAFFFLLSAPFHLLIFGYSISNLQEF